MTIEEIRKGAPQFANHYDDNGCYYVKHSFRWFIWDSGIQFYRICINPINAKPLN